jgi:predicted phage terminase large subunit-like protein
LTNFDEISPLLKAGARDNFVLFCYWYDFDMFSKRPFLKRIAKEMQRVADGEIKTLAVSLPPRAGKSYITTLFCAWLLGKEPTESVMRNTCTATLARKLSRDTRDVVQSEKFKEVFPDVAMSADNAAVDGWSLNTSRNVGYFGQGVGGTIIGFGASKVAITDDLFKSIEEAMSETVKEKTLSWLHGTHESRMEKGCASIDIGTRWTRDDVIGTRSKDGFYDVEIVIPALDENSNSFCEDVMSTEEYHAKRERTEESIWSAEYMQEPVDAKGRLFENIRTFNELEQVKSNAVGSLCYVDVANDGSDYLCAVFGLVYGQSVYIVDAVYTKANSDTTIPVLANKIKEYQSSIVWIETNGMGALYYKMLESAIAQLQFKTDLRGFTNSTNKKTRILMHSAKVLNDFYFLNEDKGEYGQYIKALKNYSSEGQNKNDDAPDATTGLSMGCIVTGILQP